MVQVDVFWTYALGAGFAVAASDMLSKDRQEKNDPWYASPYFTATLLYLAVLFAPSGVCLLWAFPSWETMHVGDRNLPAWLVTLFAATNITQGVLGYWVARRLILAGKRYLAFLQIVFGYFMMFFILVHGWDGTGYQRFFSATKADVLNWKLANLPSWFVSDVALTLYLFGIVLIPVLLWAMGTWIVKGAQQSKRAADAQPGQVVRTVLQVIFIASVGLAVAASLLVHLLGWVVGLLIFAGAAYFLALRRGAWLHRLAGKMLLEDQPLP